jgi:hypothetical protein
MKEVCDLEKEDGFIPYNTTGSAKKVHLGHLGLLQPVKEQLSQFITKLHD